MVPPAHEPPGDPLAGSLSWRVTDSEPSSARRAGPSTASAPRRVSPCTRTCRSRSSTPRARSRRSTRRSSPARAASADADADEQDGADADAGPDLAGRHPEELSDEDFDEVEDEVDEAARTGEAPARARPPAARPRRAAEPARRGNRLIGFLRASWAELQRVQWPDRRQVGQATAVVLGFVIVAGAYLGLADQVAKQIVDFII